jgi:dTDP-4-dehydrorhamnose reductase
MVECSGVEQSSGTGESMRILVTGARGQVAAALLRAGARQDGINVTVLGRPDLDLERPSRAAIAREAPDVVVNAAAYTAVDRAETEEQRALSINAERAEAIAEAASALDLPVIQMSSDYVFPGDKDEPYSEADEPAPLNAFGRSKLAGERLVAAANPRHVILRTSWIYGDAGRNFAVRMLEQAATQDEISVVDDQYGAPTLADDIAAAILKVAANLLPPADEHHFYGVFHLTAAGRTTWHGFAQAIFAASRQLGGPVASLRPIRSVDYPTTAARPRNSCLDCSRLAAAHGITLGPWEDGIEPTVAALLDRLGLKERPA